MTKYTVINISQNQLNIDLATGGALNLPPQGRLLFDTLPADVLSYYLVGYLYIQPDPLTESPIEPGTPLDQATVRSTTLTGFSSALSIPVLPSDTVLEAFGKLQGQVNANGILHGNKADLVSGILAEAQRPDASQLAFSPVGSVSANTIQGAIAELGNEKLGTGHEGSGGAVHAPVQPGGAAGFMTGADKTKLDTVQTNATSAGGTGDAYASTHQASNSAHTASSITNTPAGNIGSTNVQAALNELDVEKLTATHGGAGGAVHPDATTSVSGFMSGTDKTKLNGIATSATANATDAQLRDRATHTGTQTAATISDFNSVADTRANARIAAASINDLADVVVSSPSIGQVLKWNGTNWINDTDLNSGGGGGGGTNYKGVVANQAGMLAASTAVRGDYVIRSDRPTPGVWILKGSSYSTLGDWYEFTDYIGTVANEAGMIGMTPSREGQYVVRTDAGKVAYHFNNTGLASLATSWSDYTELLQASDFMTTYEAATIERLSGISSALPGILNDTAKTYNRSALVWAEALSFQVVAITATATNTASQGTVNTNRTKVSQPNGLSAGNVNQYVYVSAWSGSGTPGFYMIGSWASNTDMELVVGASYVSGRGNPTIVGAGTVAASDGMKLGQWTIKGNSTGKRGRQAIQCKVNMTSGAAKLVRVFSGATAAGSILCSGSSSVSGVTTFAGDFANLGSEAINCGTPLLGNTAETKRTIDTTQDQTYSMWWYPGAVAVPSDIYTANVELVPFEA